MASSSLPGVNLKEIFPYLLPQELARVSRVCKVWREIATHPILWGAFDLEKLFPLKVIDEKAWNSYADLTIDDIELLDNRRAIPEISRFFARLKRETLTIAENAGATLLTLPKNFTLQDLEKCAAAPRRGSKIDLRYLQPWARMEMLLNSNPKMRRVLITNGVIAETRGMFFDQQKKLLENIGCRMGKGLEILSLAVMTHFSSISLFSKIPTIYTEGPGSSIFKVKNVSGSLHLDLCGQFDGTCAVQPLEIPALEQTLPLQEQTAVALQVPKEIFASHIFKGFSPFELARISSVCKEWYSLAFDPILWNAFALNAFFPVTIFDEEDWRKHANLTRHGAFIHHIHPMDNRVAFPQIARFFSRLKRENVEIEGNAGITILSLPMLLCLRSLNSIIKSPANGFATLIEFAMEDILTQLGDDLVDDSYRIIITNSLLAGSRNTPFALQQDLVEKIGCRLPKLIEIATLCTVRFIRSRFRLFPEETFSRTYDCLGRHRLVAGGFSEGGIQLNASLCYPPSMRGVAAVQILDSEEFDDLRFQMI